MKFPGKGIRERPRNGWSDQIRVDLSVSLLTAIKRKTKSPSKWKECIARKYARNTIKSSKSSIEELLWNIQVV